jgi:DNA repair ATPase RecN
VRIQSVEIDSVLGTEYVRFDAGALTILRGRNGSGKSSVIKAVLKVFEGGHDPAMLRHGAKKGFIRLTLSDGSTITKTITEKRSTVEYLDPAGNPVPSAQTAINHLQQAIAADPGRLLNPSLKAKDIRALLLQIVRVEFDPAEIAEALPKDQTGIDAPLSVLDLDGFRKYIAGVREQRRRIGQDARDAEGTVEELRKSLPPDDDTDWPAEEKRLTQTAADLSQNERKECGAIGDEADNARNDVHRWYEAELKRLSDEREEKLATISKMEKEAVADIASRYTPERERIAGELATAKERAAAQQRAAGTRQSIERAAQKCRTLNGRYDRISIGLEKMAALEAAKLDELPISGVKVTEESVLVDGTEWEHVNTARKLVMAAEIAAQQAGELPILLMDNTEAFDSMNWDALAEGAKAAGFQIMAARVDDDHDRLKIESVPFEETVNA